MKNQPILYWQKHRRYTSNGRLLWYAEKADERFWYEHWKERMSQGSHSSFQKHKVFQDELGSKLLKEMVPQGIHLEAGCGTGYWVAALRSCGLNVEGIEYSRELVDLVNSTYPDIPVSYGDALHIDRPSNYYDTYISIGVVEHRFDGPEPFLLEAYRVLKPGGKILISVPFFGAIRKIRASLSSYEHGRPDIPFFQYAFTKKEFCNLLLACGFIVERSFPLYVHRMLAEELPIYKWLAYQRGWGVIKKVSRWLLNGQDGHMLLVVGHKPKE